MSDPNKTHGFLSPRRALAAASALALAGTLTACNSTGEGHLGTGTAATAGETSAAASQAPASANANPTAPIAAPHFAKTYSEQVQSNGGVGSYDYFNANGEWAKLPHNTTIHVGCVAIDPNNQILTVHKNAWYVDNGTATGPDGSSISDVGRLTPADSYYNTTNPAILALPLSEQPVWDPQIPECTGPEMAAWGLAQSTQQ